MADNVYTVIPRQFFAGDGFSFKAPMAAFPATSWSLQFIIQLSAGAFIVAAASDHTVTVLAADTVSLAPGNWPMFYRYTSLETGQVMTEPKGSMSIQPSATGAYVKSAAEELLETLEAAILKLSSKFTKVVRINGEEFVFADLKDMRAWRTQLIAEIAGEKIRAGQKNVKGGSRTIQTRFRSS